MAGAGRTELYGAAFVRLVPAVRLSGNTLR
jgi:hypothetical protein